MITLLNNNPLIGFQSHERGDDTMNYWARADVMNCDVLIDEFLQVDHVADLLDVDHLISCWTR